MRSYDQAFRNYTKSLGDCCVADCRVNDPRSGRGILVSRRTVTSESIPDCMGLLGVTVGHGKNMGSCAACR